MSILEPRAVRCKAMNRQGSQCANPAVNGREVCRMHGGNSGTVGIAHHAYVDGEKGHPPLAPRRRYSLVGKLHQGYEDMLADKVEILNATDEIALLLARIQIAVEAQEELPVVSDRLFRAFDGFLVARASGNVAKLQQAFGELSVAFEVAKESHDAAKEFIPLMETLRRTRETEMKRRLAMRQSLTIEDARKFFRTIQGIVLEGMSLISDERERMAFRKHFATRVEQAFTSPTRDIHDTDLRQNERTQA